MKELEEAALNSRAFVIEQMQAGVNRTTIIRKLIENMGMNSSDATDMVTTVHDQVMKAAVEEQVTVNSILLAIIGGGIAAIVGGSIWGLIVIATDYEIGFMAIGIGLLSGFAVSLFSRGKKGVPIQIIAVIASIAGIAIGKYITFFHLFKQMISKDYGLEEATSLSIFSDKIIKFFAENIGLALDYHDILWILLAFYAAWKIPKGLGIKLSR